MKRTSREWKQKRAEFIEGKVCAWCGSSDRLCIHTPGVLSPTEIRSGIYNLAYARFKEVYRQKNQKFEDILTGKHRPKSHPIWHKSSTIHKTEPDTLTLKNRELRNLLKIKERGTLNSSIVNGLRKMKLKSLLKRRLKKQRKNVHLWNMQPYSASVATLHVCEAWKYARYVERSIRLPDLKPVLTACLKKKRKTFL